MSDLSGYLPLSAILANMAAYFRMSVDTQPGWKANAISAVNRALEEAAELRDWPELMRNSELQLRVQGDTTSDTLQSGEAYFVAPWACRRIDAMTMMAPAKYVMNEVSSETLLNLMTTGTDSASGQPKHFAHWGWTAQHAALAAEGALTVLSDSTLNGSDGSNKRVVVTYRQAGHHLGESRQVNVEGDFDTGVALPTAAVAGWPIESVQLPSGWAGSLTIQDASANVIVDVPKKLLPESAASSGHATYRRRLYRMERSSDVDRGGNLRWLGYPRRLSSGSDVPDIPVSNYLIEKATATMYAVRGNVVASRSHEANARDSVEDSGARETKRHGTAPPRFGNVLGMTGVRTWPL